MKNEVHKYDKVVIGSTLEGLVYAYLHGLPVFYPNIKRPVYFDTLEPNNIKWDFINHDNMITTVKTPEKEIMIGSSKLLVWNKLSFMLSFTGLMPCSNPQSLRIDEDLIKITTENNKLLKIKANEILLFDDENVEGLTQPYKLNESVKVYDWIEFSRFSQDINFNLIQTEYDFCNKLWIITSKDKRAKYDGCIISNASNLLEVQNELTDYVLRFTLKSIFKKYDIKGRCNGIDNRYGKAKQKYVSVRPNFFHRDIIKDKPNLYYDYDNIKCMTHLSLNDILKEKDNTNYVTFNKCMKLTKRTDHQVLISTLLE